MLKLWGFFLQQMMVHTLFLPIFTAAKDEKSTLVFVSLNIFHCYTQSLQKSTEKMEKEKKQEITGKKRVVFILDGKVS